MLSGKVKIDFQTWPKRILHSTKVHKSIGNKKGDLLKIVSNAFQCYATSLSDRGVGSAPAFGRENRAVRSQENIVRSGR
ncbi:hypothetical protein D7D25_01310 [Proteiniphilum sp. X52]|nr:hypothetical protein D7D25_01310 [Proteiniphilum sp. X52]